MPANPPISNENNDDNNEFTGILHPTSLFIEPGVESIATADKALGAPSLETNNMSTADPITSSDITLTPRQQRVLRYLARRRMRNAYIIKRSTHDKRVIKSLAPVRATPIPETIDAPGQAEQSLIDVSSASTQPLHATSRPETIIAPGEAEQLPTEIFLTGTQPLDLPSMPELPKKEPAKAPQIQ